jgi:extradiol dioxygenase family protein
MHARIVSVSDCRSINTWMIIDFLAMDIYTHIMIQSEYTATGNQLGEICRNGNEKVI